MGRPQHAARKAEEVAGVAGVAGLESGHELAVHASRGQVNRTHALPVVPHCQLGPVVGETQRKEERALGGH